MDIQLEDFTPEEVEDFYDFVSGNGPINNTDMPENAMLGVYGEHKDGTLRTEYYTEEYVDGSVNFTTFYHHWGLEDGRWVVYDEDTIEEVERMPSAQ